MMTINHNPAIAAVVPADFTGRVMLYLENGQVTGHYRMRENEHAGTIQELVELAREAGWGDAQIAGVPATDGYCLVRGADGKVIQRFPDGGRWQLYTTNGIASVVPLSDDEIIITPTSMIQILERLGYHVTNTIRD